MKGKKCNFNYHHHRYYRSHFNLLVIKRDGLIKNEIPFESECVSHFFRYSFTFFFFSSSFLHHLQLFQERHP